MEICRDEDSRAFMAEVRGVLSQSLGYEVSRFCGPEPDLEPLEPYDASNDLSVQVSGVRVGFHPLDVRRRILRLYVRPLLMLPRWDSSCREQVALLDLNLWSASHDFRLVSGFIFGSRDLCVLMHKDLVSLNRAHLEAGLGRAMFRIASSIEPLRAGLKKSLGENSVLNEEVRRGLS